MSLDHHWPAAHNSDGAYSIDDAALFLPFGPAKLRRLCREGQIPEAVDHTSIGLGWRIPYRAMEAIHARYCHLDKDDHHA